MKICLIDDSFERHRRFGGIVTCLQDMTETDVEPGFGVDPEQAVKRCLDVNELTDLFINEPSAILVMDMDLGAHGNSKADSLVENLREMARLGNTTRGVTIERALVKYSEAKREGRLHRLQSRFPLATLLLLLGREVQFPAILTSTEITGGEIETVVKEGLAVRTPGAIYASEEESEQDEQELAEVWCNKLSQYLMHPLEQISHKTDKWFTKNAPLGIPRHNAEWDHISVVKHKECVRKILPCAPESWWSNEGTAVVTHNVLKDTIGDHAGWIARGSDARPLPLAGAYLLFHIVLYRRFPKESDSLVAPDLSSFFPLKDREPAPLSFLPPQGLSDAKRSIVALYDFFNAIIALDASSGPCAIEKMELPTASRSSFRAKLRWEKWQIRKLTDAMRGFASEAIDENRIPSLDKTIGAFLRFLLASQVRNSGVGTIGTISIDGSGWMKVGL